MAAVLDHCAQPPPQHAQTARVRHIIDGDTLILSDGRPVRLLGINTPELGKNGHPDQPLARAARQALQQLLPPQSRVTLITGKQPRDRYHRTLAHLYDKQGRSIEQQLLRQGMAFQITIPPNLEQRDCLRQAERYARQRRLGVWAEATYRALPAARLSPRQQGFQRVTGRITRTGRGRNNLQLELDNRLFVLIRQNDLHYFDPERLLGLLGRDVEVRGWIVARTLSAKQRKRGFKPFLLSLRHPDALSIQDE